jgi:diketogulonate reductase-like aldo/keto reductase
MKTRFLAGRSIPVVGQGTWKLEKTPKEAAIYAIQYGIEQGLTHIDTAEMYGDGQVEKLVGEAIQNFDRQNLFLVSKVLPTNASYKNTIKPFVPLKNFKIREESDLTALVILI